jgi:hypothetical protein
MEEDVGGLARCSGDAVGRQRPDRDGSGQATHARVPGAKQRRLGRQQVGPSYSNGRRRFELDPNVKFKRIQTVQIFSNFDLSKKHFPCSEKLK